MADSCLRRSEVIALDWDDVVINSGLVQVWRGKGGKSRSAIVGATTRCAILSYRHFLGTPASNSHLFQSKNSGRFSGPGSYKYFEGFQSKQGYLLRFMLYDALF